MSSTAPPIGYSQMEQWLCDVTQPLADEAKDLATRGFDVALAAAKDRGEPDPEGIAVGAMVGLCVQMGLMVIGKTIEIRSGARIDSIANYMAGEIRASTLITFSQMVHVLNQAAAPETTKQ